MAVLLVLGHLRELAKEMESNRMVRHSKHMKELVNCSSENQGGQSSSQDYGILPSFNSGLRPPSILWLALKCQNANVAI